MYTPKQIINFSSKYKSNQLTKPLKKYEIGNEKD